jgi:hypothetical protein
MKNLAICMSGAIRSFHLCYESINQMVITPLKKEYNVYIFGHFWTLKQEENIGDLAYTMKWKKECEGVHEIIRNFGFTEYVTEDYNAKREEEIQTRLENSNCSPSGSDNCIPSGSDNCIPSGSDNCSRPRLAERILASYRQIQDPEKRLQYVNYAVNCMGMYYKIMMSNSLKNDWAKKNNIKFDYTIRMRPDFFWNEPIQANIFKDLTDKNIVLVYDNYCTHAKWLGNDKFFGGTDAMMNEYCCLYNHFAYFFEKDIRIEGQELARAMIKKMDLNIVFFGNENTYDKCAGSIHRKLERVQAKSVKHNKKSV